MTNRQKFIAGCINPYNPYSGKFATKVEVKQAKQLAKGKYWHDVDNMQYVAFSPGGKRNYFEYDESDNTKSIAKKSAALWSKARCSEAIEMYYWF